MHTDCSLREYNADSYRGGHGILAAAALLAQYPTRENAAVSGYTVWLISWVVRLQCGFLSAGVSVWAAVRGGTAPATLAAAATLPKYT